MSIDKIYISVPLKDSIELERLMRKIEMPDVTYDDEILLMAQQAIRLSRRYADEAHTIIRKWNYKVLE